MKADTNSVNLVFGQDVRLLVPLFQRPYVWKEEVHWESLWQDVVGLAGRLIRNSQEVRPHFLGAIVLDPMPTALGKPVPYLIVDGQQRLATIQILMEALADVCASIGAREHYDALRRLTRNQKLACEKPDDEFKVWPTNVDQDQYRSVMLATSAAELQAQHFPAPHRIANAYCFFYERIVAWLSPGTPGHDERLKALYTALGDGLRMVVIYLGGEDDAQMIFETLNARGEPLLPSDLVKNFLLHRGVGEGDSAEDLYKRFWQPFDNDEAYWREEIGIGRSKRFRIDVYLQHYLTLKTRDEVPVGQLYAAFRRHADQQKPDGNRSLAREHLASLLSYAPVYKGFDKFDTTGSPTRKELFFGRLKQMDTTTAHPFLLELYADPSRDPSQVEQVLTHIESFLVRRMVCHLTAKGYNRLFIDMLAELDGAPLELADRVRAFLANQSAESLRWPTDAEFRDAWLNEPLYRQIQSGRVRMLLEAVNWQLTTPRSVVVRVVSKLTVEHLMPVKWRDYWPLPQGLPTQEAILRRDRLIHTLGNLTLLTRR